MAIAYSLPAPPSPDTMVDLRLPPVPADLKHVLPFLQRAQEVHARDPCVCYWSMYYVAHLGMRRPQTKENKPFLAAVVDQLEGMKRNLRGRRQVSDEAAGSSHVRRFGFNVFEAANNEDVQGNASRSTAKKFLAASYFLEILRLFGPLDAEASFVEETIRYAKFKAADIVRCLREGVTPTPGIPAVPTRSVANGHTITPSNLSPQTNPILLSTRPSTLQSPAESPTTGAPRSRIPQPNYPPAPTESGSGSAPVSPRNTPVKVSLVLDGARQERMKPESIALPTSGSSSDLPLPGTASPKKPQSPVPRTRSPLTAPANVFQLSSRSTPVARPKLLPTASKLASPVKVVQEISATPAPVVQQLPPHLPLASTSYAPEPSPVQGTVSPTMSSTMTIDSTDTFTSSQLETVIQSGSMAALAAPRAQSPVKAESTTSTDLTEAQSYTSDETETVDSPLMPVLTVVDTVVAAKEVEVALGTEEAHTSNLVAITSPVVDDWDLGREVTQALRQLTPPAPPVTHRSAPDVSPLSLARSTPMPESPEAALLATPTQTPAPTTLSLMTTETMVLPEPTVVIPRSPTQPSPTSNISPNSPSTISPVSLDMALAQNQSFKSAAELIDAELWKVYGKLDIPTQESGADEGIDIEVESGSSVSSGSTLTESESEGESNQGEDESDDQSDSQSIVSEVKVLATATTVGPNGESVQQSSGFELKSLIKTSKSGEANEGAQFEAVVRRKTVRFAPSVVGGLSPEIPKQILPPMTPGARTSPPLPIIPSSMVVHASQPLVRPKSLTIRSSVDYDHQQPSSMSPNSPTYTHGAAQYASSGLVALPPLVDGRPPEDFAIIPFHPSMSASHPPPAVQNNPAYLPASQAVVHGSWGPNSSPPQRPSQPYRRNSAVDRDTAALAQKYSRFAISSLNYMDVENAKKELRAALALLEGEAI
ncbi:vacuolar protein sorting-associated VTA1-like protein [Ceratobasidium sp. AG-Ba]|nr:vacuolar protein sorting-associated VTA1-like protein [Ceratobasidium sp. AG-Ba]